MLEIAGLVYQIDGLRLWLGVWGVHCCKVGEGWVGDIVRLEFEL